MRRTDPRFPLSRSTKTFKERWDAGKDPLDFLNPNEIVAAELWAACRFDPAVQKTPFGTPDTRAFATRFREHFGFELTSAVKSGLLKNPAWNAYIKSLMTQTRDAVMKKLEQQALRAHDTYIWAQEEARKEGDYKEARIAAADHLDRVGITQKPTVEQKAIVIEIHDQRRLHRELPAVEAAEIVQE